MKIFQYGPLWESFLWSADRFPDRPAVVVDGLSISYRELHEAACHIAAVIQAHPDFAAPPLTAILAYRTPAAYVGVLGALLAGNGYVPLNPNFPLERTRRMLEQSGCRVIIADAPSVSIVNHLVNDRPGSFPEPLLILMPYRHASGEISTHYAIWKDKTLPDLRNTDKPTWKSPTVSPDSIAYLLFTSGSTGIPKGVVITHGNVMAFLDYVINLYRITQHDVLSQTFDITFDLSVFDMFAAWNTGACINCPSKRTLLNPAKYIQDLTVWFSVPSTISFMQKLRLLQPNRYPDLRLSLFCGEPLPIALAHAWAAAAPNSILENLYGPTELTIACTHYQWTRRSPLEAELGITAIGHPFPHMKIMVVDATLKEVPRGEAGELLMNGPQMSPGYWQDPEKNAATFVVPPGRNEVFYRTGDRVRQVADGSFRFLGRIDSQIKVLGHRVELGEVEAVVHEITGVEAVAVGWPVTPSGFGGVEVFIEHVSEPPDLRAMVASRLPEYMVPRRVHVLSSLPRNANGKLDRRAILQLMEETSAKRGLDD